VFQNAYLSTGTRHTPDRASAFILAKGKSAFPVDSLHPDSAVIPMPVMMMPIASARNTSAMESIITSTEGMCKLLEGSAEIRVITL